MIAILTIFHVIVSVFLILVVLHYVLDLGIPGHDRSPRDALRPTVTAETASPRDIPPEETPDRSWFRLLSRIVGCRIFPRPNPLRSSLAEDYRAAPARGRGIRKSIP